ncbi:RING finger protein 141 [Plakobranchus ocellatus]|uniref:RING finger protein 141 n=1 Tax=Plakobranchus ocellatus TaxID=259542 RepID=A0AAV3ZGV5_9GAST|nr:RING finger protein 141 [Plakobranchus ocellatus]
MGQNPSVSMATYAGEGELNQVQTRLQAQLTILKSLARVSHKEVLACIAELNSVTRTFTDRSGKQLRFMVRKGTDTTFLWKATIRIACVKVNTSANTVESSRLLTLRQFVVIYKEITEQVAALSRPIRNLEGRDAQSQEQDPSEGTSACKVDELTASAFFPKPANKWKNQDLGDGTVKETECQGLSDNLAECCVCMDRKACVMLSCCHEFCELCIDNWTRDESHSTCPLCRSKVEGNDDTWVLTDQQDQPDFEHEVSGYLLGLADRSGRPAEPHQHQEVHEGERHHQQQQQHRQLDSDDNDYDGADDEYNSDDGTQR